MKKSLATLIEAFRSNPVRVRMYGLALLTAGYLQDKGVIQEVDAKFATGAALIILAVETTRQAVTPTRNLEN